MAAGWRVRGLARWTAAVAVALSVASTAVGAVVGASPPPAAVAAEAPAALAATGGNNCLRRLVTHPAEFARCRTDTICFLFIEEDPFIVIGKLDNHTTSPLNPRIPFPCTAFAERDLSGFAFKLHEKLWPTGPDLRVYAGDIDECTFSGMVNYINDSRTFGHPGYGHALGVTGALVFSPDRRRLGISSDSILEDTLLMVGRRGSGLATWGSPFNAAALSAPFTNDAWKVVAQAGACVVALTGALSAWRPTPVLGDGGRRACSRQFRRTALQWVFNFVRNLAGGDLEPEEGGFAPAQALLRSIPWVLLAIVILFYEAAFIIGGSATGLSKPLRGLTDEELCRWTVPRDTALEFTWLELVNLGRGNNPINISGVASGATPRTWNTCDSAAHCFAQVTEGVENPASGCAGGRARTTDILVTFRPVIYSMFRQQPHLCSSLEVLEEAEDTFRFSVGWMYAAVETANDSAAAVWAARREEIDVALRRARLDQTTKDTLAEAVGSDVPCQASAQRVHAGQLVPPIAVTLVAYYIVVVWLAIGYPWLRYRLRAEIQPYV